MKRIIISLFWIAALLGPANMPLAFAKNVNEQVILAGGCFWCTESVFEGVPGVVEAVAGYTGGAEQNAGYQQVGSGKTGHYEAVQITYDPAQISFNDVLKIFWQDIDPTDGGGQFADRGSQYRTAIFYTSEAQKEMAERSKDALEASGRFKKPIVTEILKAETFYPAEEYHQDYSQKNPERYKRYRKGSGRAGFVEKMWGDKE